MIAAVVLMDSYPLCLLHIHQQVTNTVVDFLWSLALHGTHGSVVHRVGNPAPVHELKKKDGRPRQKEKM